MAGRYFQANNSKIVEAADAIVFEGLQQSQNGRAAFLTFCTFIAFGSLALVLTIFEQAVTESVRASSFYLTMTLL